MRDSSHDKTLSEPFVRVLLANQGRIYAYITSLLGDPPLAEELLQETNVVLCRQADQFESINDFAAWACRIAYFEVMTFRKREQRDRHMFDDRVLLLVAEEANSQVEEFERRHRALSQCLSELSEQQRKMIMERYGRTGSVRAIAEEYGRSPGSISQTLYRIRTALLKCIERRLAVAE
jgi:RNA polymerase sigma-70 factor (ECF subfamily)